MDSLFVGFVADKLSWEGKKEGDDSFVAIWYQLNRETIAFNEEKTNKSRFSWLWSPRGKAFTFKHKAVILKAPSSDITRWSLALEKGKCSQHITIKCVSSDKQWSKHGEAVIKTCTSATTEESTTPGKHTHTHKHYNSCLMSP